MGFSRLVFMLLLLTATVVRADVTVITDLQLTGFGVTPGPGTGGGPLLSGVSIFAQALNSFGGSDAQSKSSSSGTIAASASTLWATATTVATANSLPGGAVAEVNILNNLSSFASSTGQATWRGSLEITGTTGTVTGSLSAGLSVDQFLMTSGAGVFASSEAIFTLTLPDIQSTPLLAYDNLLTIGPNQTTVFTDSPVSTAFVTLTAGTPYPFIAALDVESFGVSTPEPASLALLATAAGIAAVLRRRTRLRG